MALKLITAPASTPISLAEVKRHLRIDSAAQDQNLELYIDAATASLDGVTGLLGRAIVTQTWDLYLDEFPASEIQIPLPPLSSVTSVNYYPPSGSETTVSSSNYTVDTVSVPGWIVPNSNFSWPTTLDAVNAVRIRFVAGYSAVPPDLKLALLHMVGGFYQGRESWTRDEMRANPVLKHLLGPYIAEWF